jgi:large subunit ribosomal protein L23
MVKGLIGSQKQSDTQQNLGSINFWSEILLYDSIKYVVTSKKALWSIDNQVYCFLVKPYLTKPLIKSVIEKYFNVRVLKINTSNLPRRKKRVGKYAGFCQSYKKVTVRLNYDDQINLFSDI